MSDTYIDDDDYSACSSSVEWYWCDDADPTDADDLAEYTLPSPVWDEDGYYTRETWEHHSDWEYYSDDYFDQSTQEKTRKLQDDAGQLSPKEHLSGQDCKRIRPRQQRHPQPRYARSIKGTVFRNRREYGELNTKPQNLNYKPGEADKVALLEDWRKVFLGSQPQSDKRREQQIYNQSLPNQDLDLPHNHHNPQTSKINLIVNTWMENQEPSPKTLRRNLETASSSENLKNLNEHVMKFSLSLDNDPTTTAAKKSIIDDAQSSCTSESLSAVPKKRKAATAAADERSSSSHSIRSRRIKHG